MRFPFLLIASLSYALLAGCGSSDRNDAVGGVSAGEAQALNEAAEMLDSRRMKAEAALQKEPAPVDNPADTAAARK